MVNEKVPYLQSILNHEEIAKRNIEDNKALDIFEFNNVLSFDNIHFSYDSDKKYCQVLIFQLKRRDGRINRPFRSGKNNYC